jgi:hypothetical protein
MIGSSRRPEIGLMCSSRFMTNPDQLKRRWCVVWAATSSTGTPVAGAIVSVVVKRNGTIFSTGTASTNVAGNAMFELRNAPSGTYHTQISGVDKSGLAWDQITPTNQFSK